MRILSLSLIALFFIALIPFIALSYNIEQPFTTIYVPEKASPSNWIKENQIKVYSDKVVIEMPNVQWAKFTDSNSMDPAIDSDSNALEVIPSSYEDIHVGDIISYEISEINGTIIHRVVETGFDESGWYAKTKGDNIPEQDPFKIRFENVKRIVIAIIY